MREVIENALRSFISALQIAKLYGTDHAKYRKFLDKAYDDLLIALKERGELVIGIIGEELAFDKEILFELSRNVRPIITYLTQREIQRICFARNLEKGELAQFIAFLMLSKDEIKKDENTLGRLRTIEAGKIKASSEATPENIAQVANFLSFYNNSLDNVSNSLENVLNARQVDNLDLKFSVTTLFENLIARHQEFMKLAVVKRYDESTFVHIFNVSLLTMYFSLKLGFSKDEVLDIGIAALFHDIGKMSISRKIIRKAERLTDGEFNRMRGHSVLGAEILLEYVQSLGVLPVVVAFEHHLRADGKGYPKLPAPRTPHIASTIVSICDVYDALFERRSYKSGYPANVIYSLMARDKSRYFEPALFDIFFKIVGVWPIGTIVALTDSRVAVVRDENEDDIFSPIVEIISSSERVMIDLRADRERLRIDRSLDPQTEAKDYLKQI